MSLYGLHGATVYAENYVEKLINPINGKFIDEQLHDYHFMTRYLMKAFHLAPLERNLYLPETIKDNFGIVSLGQPYWIKKYLNKNKDDFFNKFYYYKGLNSL
ncbi:hypothetical protein [Moraxella bovis]|uniref:Uncharacterized protein n=1 Tax=Moraxella bovis TaxID=476 RepID=A0ABY6M6E0_MORBO|nr:hypothetical protein [Moraxella bovis]UZA02948.1 hypothetical protein LP092_13585 [Moraxella bovis]UZA19159.1 hypothetical protein LP088_12825 [Moraxella bovis]UZA54041.1 hypothetical protein LP111_12800 [Moraxella bovis]UZA57353.1 hypothetical protein LP127_01375 [Moraxella bovis]